MTDALRDRLQASLGTAYAIERELGGGGMSRVFVAEETRLARSVVVKILTPERAEGVSSTRFEREIATAARLQHPNIVPVLAAGVTDDGLPYYTMPFVAGESLRHRLVNGPLSLGDAVSVLRDVARALAAAHDQGIVHRDVKPENVLLARDAAVVTDFGIAMALSASKTLDPAPQRSARLTEVGASLGTPAYMAPEQAAGDAVDRRADLYAWGVLAYELLAGRHPYANHTTAQQLVAAQLTEAPAPLGSVAPAVPRPLATLVMRCLEKDPARRPSTAGELLAMLDASAAAPRARSIVPLVGALVIVAAGAVALGRSRAATSAAPATLRIAVLPFEHQGPAEQAVFADGLTDVLTAKLGALPSLAVIDRHSASQYRGTTKPSRQIGSELGVRYLLEGVVRWARDGSGAWRAQVVPTLVDAESGTTRWTGEPQVMTPSDPFTAQGEIAARVIDALQLTITPGDAASLRRRLTNDPEAFAAYVRGRARLEDFGRAPVTEEAFARIATEFRDAVTTDSMFGDAWAHLAWTEATRAVAHEDALADRRRVDEVIVHARERAPEHAMTLLAQAVLAAQRKDRVAMRAFTERAISHAGNDALVLAFAASSFATDSGYAAVRRAASIDPRSPIVLTLAGLLATNARRWGEGRAYADAVLALDSTDERGWAVLLGMQRMQGDTVAMQRTLATLHARVPRPSGGIEWFMAYAGGSWRRRFLSMSAPELGLTELGDILVNYLDCKADALLALGDTVGARVYADSMSRLVRMDATNARGAIGRVRLAYVHALLGDTAEARRELTVALADAPAKSMRADLSDALDPVILAALYARLRDTASAVHWLEVGLAAPTGWTARGYAVYPKLRALHGVPAFERLIAQESR